jgi:phosphate transport system substrate-binding protein
MMRSLIPGSFQPWKFAVTTLLVTSAGVNLTACCQPSTNAAQPKKVVLTGSSSVAPLMGEMAKRYEAQHPGSRVDVQSGGSSRGIADARQGAADIGMVSRGLKSEESDLQSFTIAKDGISVILHKNNPVANLSDDQIVQIYTKKINNWRLVGGGDAPITVVNKAEGRSTLELFAKYFKLEPKDIQADSVIGENAQAMKIVALNPDAIAYVSIGAAEFEISKGSPLKLLPIKGVEANTANVLNGKFPLSRPLNLVTKTAPAGQVKDLIEFARSKTNQDLVKSQYLVPLEP